MSRILRPTSMRGFRPFSGAGGEVRSIAGGGGGGGGGPFTEDWESYSLGAWVPADNGYTILNERANQGYDIVNGFGSFSGQMLKMRATGIDTSTTTIITPDAMGDQADGIFRMQYYVSSTTNNNNYVQMYLRWTDMNNYIRCWGHTSAAYLYIDEVVGGSATTATAITFNNRNTHWWMELIADGSDITFNLYEDAYVTLKKSCYKSVALTTAGKLGLGFYAGYTNDYAYYGDFDWSV